MFVPTATMANEIALRVLGEPGDELIAEENAHILIAELGGPAVHAGLMTRPCPPRPAGSRPTRCARRRAAATSATCRRRGSSRSRTRTTLPAAGSGRLPRSRRWRTRARARAEPAHRRRPALQRGGRQRRGSCRDCGTRDTVTICFSKGLGCPLGAIVAGSAERMLRARRCFTSSAVRCGRPGSSPRPASTRSTTTSIASPTTTHAPVASRRVHEAGVPVDLEQVETNFVQVDVGSLGWTSARRSSAARRRRPCLRNAAAGPARRSPTSGSRTKTSSRRSRRSPRARRSAIAGEEERERSQHVGRDQNDASCAARRPVRGAPRSGPWQARRRRARRLGTTVRAGR